MMTDDRFERILPDILGELGRMDASDLISDVVATTATIGQRPGWTHGEWWVPELGYRPRAPIRRLLIAAALVALATVGVLAAGAALRTPEPEPKPTPVVTFAPSAKPALAAGPSAWDAIYVRQEPDSATLLDVVLVRPDGTQRVLRRIGLDLPGNNFPLSTFGSVSQNGWLALSTTSSGQLPVAAYGLFDLTNATRDPLTVPFPPVISGHWSVDDLFALSSATEHTGTGWMLIDVVDPRTAATTHLGTVSLFGGEPSIVWARDGSGILDGRGIRPVGGGPDIPIDASTLFLDRRVGMGGSTVDVCRASDPGSVCPSHATISVSHDSGGAVAWYTVDKGPNDEPSSAIFAADGRSLLVTILRTQGQRHQAVVVRMDAPDQMVELAAVDIAPTGWNPSISATAPDDGAFTIEYWTGPEQGPDFRDAGILHTDGTVTPVTSGSFAGFVSGRLAESWPALSDFGPPPPASAKP